MSSSSTNSSSCCMENPQEADLVRIETKWYDDWVRDNVPDLTDRVAIVTGGYTGIGFFVTAALARKGCVVVMACRSVEEGRQAKEVILAKYPQAKLDVIHIEHMEFESVRAFAKEFDAKYSRLDFLLNNAGIMSQPLMQSRDGFDIQFQTNHLAHFLLTELLWHKLVSSPGQARVVNQASMIHHIGGIIFDKHHMEDPTYSWGPLGANVMIKHTLFPLAGFRQIDRWKRYAMSKLCNVLMMRELAHKIRERGLEDRVAALACHPGWASTHLHRDARDAESNWKTMTKLYGQSAADGSLPMLMAAVSSTVENGDYVGPSRRLEFMGLPTKCKVRANAKNMDMAESLWEYSEECIGEKFVV